MYQNGHLFFVRKYKILQLYPNGNLIFYRKIQNLTAVTKRSFDFLQGNTKFYSCNQTTISYLQRNAKFWKFYPNGHSWFYNEIQNFKRSTQTDICISHKEIRNLTIYWAKSKNIVSRYFVSLLFTMKNEIRNIMELWNTHYLQKGL